MKIFRIVLNIIFVLGFLCSFASIVHLDEKINDIDNAVFEYMKNDFNEKACNCRK